MGLGGWLLALLVVDSTDCVCFSLHHVGSDLDESTTNSVDIESRSNHPGPSKYLNENSSFSAVKHNTIKK